MAEATTGFDLGLADYIDKIETLQGEAENIVDAAVRDVAESFSGAMRRAWPVGSGKGTRSATRWTWAKDGPARFVVTNDASYATYVWIHPNTGSPSVKRRKGARFVTPPAEDVGPPGLAHKLFDRAVPELQEHFEDLVSERVAGLLRGGS